MELKESKRKKCARSELKSALPLVFGSKGELTQFHATLTYLGSCIVDPAEMEIVYKMGYFGKGSLSKSHPKFGRIHYGAPPIIRKRQWKRREEWINEVQKLSKESYFDDDIKNDNNSQSSRDDTDDKTTELNDTVETLNSNCDSETISALETDNKENLDKLSNDVEILGSDKHNNQTNGQSSQMDVDEVVLDSNEEEDVCEISEDSFNINNDFDKEDLFNKIGRNGNYNKSNTELQEKVLVLSDSDSDTDNYLINIKPQIKDERFPVRETLHLTFEETFFLMYGLGCLRVVDFDGKFISIGEVWNCFCKEQKNFLPKYITYHYFRSKGWVVKTGLKYGGDFILYKEGPPFYHSSYVVIIDVLDAVTFKRIESKATRNMTWNKFVGLQRLAETVGKEVLFAQVLWPSTVPTDTSPTSPDVLSQFTVREILWRRWKLNQDPSSTNLEENDNDVDDEDYSS